MQFNFNSAETYDGLAKKLIDKVKKSNMQDKSEKQNSPKSSIVSPQKVPDSKVTKQSDQKNLVVAKKAILSDDVICSGSDSNSKNSHFPFALAVYERLNFYYKVGNYHSAILIADVIIKGSCYDAVKLENFLLEHVPSNYESNFYPHSGAKYVTYNGIDIKWYTGHESFCRLLYNLNYEKIYPLHFFLQSLIIKGLCAIKIANLSVKPAESIYYGVAKDCFNKAMVFKHGIFQNPEINNLYTSSYIYIQRRALPLLVKLLSTNTVSLENSATQEIIQFRW